MACPTCGAVAPDEARFCPSCGHALTVRSDERRIVTVLFADLVGFTTLSETADPESVKNLVDDCFERLVAEIDSFGGKVDKIVGDAIVALFGAPVAHEDDAERAVRAALRMQETLALHATDAGVDVRMRIGVNTGEVLVGALRAGGDYTAMGDVVNTASRLQTAAQPGQVLVGPATYAATHEVIAFESIGELQAKGRDEPVPAWTATATLLPPGYRPYRLRAPLIGRVAELGILSNAVDSAVHHRRAQLLLLVGEAGVGKSRLAEEIAALAETEHDAIVLEGRCVPYGEANVWWPVAEALRQALSLSADAPFTTAKDHADDVVSRTLELAPDAEETSRIVEGILYLLGYEVGLRDIDPQRARDEATRSVLTLVEGYAATRPVVVVLSDLHWADGVVLDMIDDLLARLGRHPYVVVATTRQGLEDRWTARPGRHNSAVINLDPLDREDAEELLDALVDGEAPADVRALLLDRSGGNPFFLEELVSLLDETGVVGQTSNNGPLRELPDTLRGLVSARLDALPVSERNTLVNAAVWGRRGPVEALEKMSKEEDPEHGDIAAALEALAEKEVLVVKARRWAFHSDLVRDVAYGTLTKFDRARKHAGIAIYLEHHSGMARDDRVVDIVAHHYAIAAELAAEMGAVPGVPDDVRDRALTWLTDAAKRAERADMHEVAARLFGQAIDLAGPTHPDRLRFLLGRAHALTEQRDLAAARVDVAAALAEADAANDRGAVARALTVLGDIEWREGDLVASSATLERAIGVFEDLGDREGVARALRSRGMADLMIGEYRNARQSLEAALEASREVEDVRGEAWALQNLAWIAFIDGRPDESEGRLHQSIALFTQIGDQGGLGWAKGLLAWVKFHLGVPDEAEDLIDEVLPEARQRGDRWGEGMMLVLRAAMRLWTGRTSEAIETGEEALSVFGQIDDRFGEFQALAPLGRALIAAGRIDEGFRTLEGLLDLEGAGEDLRNLGQTVVAGAAVQVGEPTRLPAELVCQFGEATEPATLGESERMVAVGLAALQRGDVTDALSWLEAAGSLEDDNPYADSSLALALVAADRGDEVAAAVKRAWSSPRATYLDRARASLASALAAGRRGDEAGAAEALAEVHGALDPTQDVVSQAIGCLGEAEVWASLGDPRAVALRSDAESRLAGYGIRAPGWATAFALAAATA